MEYAISGSYVAAAKLLNQVKDDQINSDQRLIRWIWLSPTCHSTE